MAVTHYFDHFQIKLHALVDALRFHDPTLFFKFYFHHASSLLIDSTAEAQVVFHHVMRLGIKRKAHVLLFDDAKQRIDLREQAPLIAP